MTNPKGKTTSWSDLRPRTLSALALVMIYGLIFALGGVWLDLGLAVTALIIFDEWRTIEARPRDTYYGLLILGLAISFLVLIAGNRTLTPPDVDGTLSWILQPWQSFTDHSQLIFPWLVVGKWHSLMIVLLFILALWRRCLIATFFTLILGFSALGLAHFADNDWLFWLGPLLIVISTDIGGYIFGKLLGGPKLWRLVSPKKTWSGFFGGIFLSQALLLLALWLVNPLIDYQNEVQRSALLAQHPALALGLGSCLSVLSQCGDLFESAIKRHYGVKDSSGLLPGHGGLYDRFDGMSIVIIVLPVITTFLLRLTY